MATTEKGPMKKYMIEEKNYPKFEKLGLHSFVYIPSLEPDYVDVDIGEPLQLLIGNDDGEVKYGGIAEIHSVKKTTIENIEPLEIERMNNLPRYTRKGVMQALRSNYPEWRGDITPFTTVEITTVKRINYDLGNLKIKKVQEGGMVKGIH